MRSDDDLKLAAELMAKYEQERAHGSSRAGGATTAEEERITAQKKLFEARADDLADIKSNAFNRVPITRNARIIACVPIFLACFLLLIAFLVHAKPQTEAALPIGGNTLLIMAGGTETGMAREIRQKIESHGNSAALDLVQNLSTSAPVPSFLWLVCLGGIRLILAVGVWFGEKLSYLILGTENLMDVCAVVVLVSLSGRMVGLSTPIVLNLPGIVICLALNAVTAFVLLQEGATSADLWRIWSWDV